MHPLACFSPIGRCLVSKHATTGSLRKRESRDATAECVLSTVCTHDEAYHFPARPASGWPPELQDPEDTPRP